MLSTIRTLKMYSVPRAIIYALYTTDYKLISLLSICSIMNFF